MTASKKAPKLSPEAQARSEKAKAAWAARRARLAAEGAPEEPVQPTPVETAGEEPQALAPVAEEPSGALQFKVLDEQPPPVEDDPIITPEQARALAPAAPEDESDEPGHVHHVHFLADGLTVAGSLHYRGGELTVKKGTPEYDYVHDKDGKCLLAMTEDEQWDRWGEVKFAPGPWRGRGYDLQAKLESGEELDEEERKTLAKINRERGLVAPGARR